MSDTPRTDNSVLDTDWLGTRVELVNADFARKLERENQQLKQTVLATLSQRGQKELIVAWDRVKELERENAGLRKDKERLDWLETNGREQIYGPTWRIAWQFGQDVSLRAVIDAARKEAQP